MGRIPSFADDAGEGYADLGGIDDVDSGKLNVGFGACS